MDLDAFRAPGGHKQGASTKAMSRASSSRKTQRGRWPSAAETLRAAAGCVASPRCRGLDVSLWIRLRPCALIRSQAPGGASEPITRTGSRENNGHFSPAKKSGDKGEMRKILATTLLSAIVVLCLYSALYHPGLLLDKCLAAPDKYDGALVLTPLESMTGAVRKGAFIVKWDSKEILVKGNTAGLTPGEYITVKGIFHREGYIEATFIHAGRYRRLKMIVSLAGAAFVLYLLYKNLRWNRACKGLEFRLGPSD